LESWLDTATVPLHKHIVLFINRIAVYFALMDDRYPSTDEEQAVHLDFPYPAENRDSAHKLRPGSRSDTPTEATTSPTENSGRPATAD